MMELTYNGREQLPEVTATGSTIGGTAITFRYGLTAVQAADETQALKTVPAFTDAGIYTVYYTASAANHDSVSGSCAPAIVLCPPPPSFSIMTWTLTSSIDLALI